MEICASGNDIIALDTPIPGEEIFCFSSGYYSGHFRETNDSNCTNNNACFGHFIDTECNLRVQIEVQMFLNGIPLRSQGSDVHNGGYSILQVLQILWAAKATGARVQLLFCRLSIMT